MKLGDRRVAGRTKRVQGDLDFQTDTELRVTHWGESMASVTGVGPLAVLGKKYHEILPPIILGHEDALLYSVRRQEEIFLRDRFSSETTA
jgi:hypothetical protein